MNPLVRVLVGYLVQFLLIFFAGWFAFNEESLGPEVPMISRLGLVVVCLVLGIVVGEVGKLRTHFGMMIGALRAATAGGGTSAVEALAGGAVPQRDPRAAVEILLEALASDDTETQEMAHRHLVRITGKELPPETALWERWWQENRERFPGADDSE